MLKNLRCSWLQNRILLVTPLPLTTVLLTTASEALVSAQCVRFCPASPHLSILFWHPCNRGWHLSTFICTVLWCQNKRLFIWFNFSRVKMVKGSSQGRLYGSIQLCLFLSACHVSYRGCYKWAVEILALQIFLYRSEVSGSRLCLFITCDLGQCKWLASWFQCIKIFITLPLQVHRNRSSSEFTVVSRYVRKIKKSRWTCASLGSCILVAWQPLLGNEHRFMNAWK